MAGPEITPQPTDEEAAAVMAAYEVLWPKPAATDAPVAQPGQWRFSGRWWHKAARFR